MQQPRLETHNSHQPHQSHNPINYVNTGHPQNLTPAMNYHSPYNIHQQQYNQYTHNAYVGYQPHYQQPPLQYQKSHPPQNHLPQQQSSNPPPYQNFTLK